VYHKLEGNKILTAVSIELHKLKGVLERTVHDRGPWVPWFNFCFLGQMQQQDLCLLGLVSVLFKWKLVYIRDYHRLRSVSCLGGHRWWHHFA